MGLLSSLSSGCDGFGGVFARAIGADRLAAAFDQLHDVLRGCFQWAQCQAASLVAQGELGQGVGVGTHCRGPAALQQQQRKQAAQQGQ